MDAADPVAPTGAAKIPVGRATIYAYGFTFRHLGSIIGLVWLPMILIALVRFLPYVDGLPQWSPGQDPIAVNPGAAATGAFVGLFSIFAYLLLMAMAYQAVAELSLGRRKPGANIFFSLSPPVWRLLGAFAIVILLSGLFVLAYGAAMGACGILTTMWLAKPVAILASAAVAIVGFCALFYVLVRLWFFVVPVTVAEGEVKLGRGWQLGYRNFWRLFAILLAVLVPLIVIQLAATAAIGGNDMLLAFQAAWQNSTGLLEQRMLDFDRHIPELLGVSLILAPFVIGFIAGAQTYVYRALVPAPPGKPRLIDPA